MTTTIVVAGKGGTGKTSISALLVQTLSSKGVVLAIDADPATNLNQALGVEAGSTVGRIREDMTRDIQSGALSPGISKHDYLEGQIRAALVEAKGFDLLAIGRPEGPGCYCAANNMLRLAIDKLGRSYRYVVIDSEAGLEHISRQTTRDVDILIIVSDPTQQSIKTAAAIKGLIGEMRTRVGQIVLVINRSPDGLPPEIARAAEGSGFGSPVIIGQDPNLAGLEIEGRPTTELPPDSPLRQGVVKLVAMIGL
ncbi:MAG: AAA family ATPase [Dehalococcoidia bacterium]|nr:AAA family ATPase [Dehalococcoidia bacterium]